MSVFRLRSCIVAVLVVLPLDLRAQARPVRVVASTVVLLATHDKVGQPMTGWSGRLDIPVTSGRYAVRAMLEQTSGRAGTRTGSLCEEFGQPAMCPDAMLRDDARFVLIGFGASRRLAAWPRGSLDASADLQHARVTATTTEQSTGSYGERDRRLWGAELGLEGSVSPWRRLPLALEIGASVGGLRPLGENPVVDDSAPFENAFGVARLRAGLSIRSR